MSVECLNCLDAHLKQLYYDYSCIIYCSNACAYLKNSVVSHVRRGVRQLIYPLFCELFSVLLTSATLPNMTVFKRTGRLKYMVVDARASLASVPQHTNLFTKYPLGTVTVHAKSLRPPRQRALFNGGASHASAAEGRDARHNLTVLTKLCHLRLAKPLLTFAQRLWCDPPGLQRPESRLA